MYMFVYYVNLVQLYVKSFFQMTLEASYYFTSTVCAAYTVTQFVI